jgi:hypothetical protein
MRTRYIYIFIGGVALFFYGLVSSCKKAAVNPVDLGQMVFTGDGSAAQLVPVGTGTGTATFSGVYDSDQRVFNFQLKWTGLDAGAATARFYGPNTAGQTGVALRDIFTTPTKGITDSITTFFSFYNRLSDSEVSDLKNGKWYYLITTANSPNGAVRGQIIYSRTFYNK